MELISYNNHGTTYIHKNAFIDVQVLRLLLQDVDRRVRQLGQGRGQTAARAADGDARTSRNLDDPRAQQVNRLTIRFTGKSVLVNSVSLSKEKTKGYEKVGCPGNIRAISK